MAATRALGLSKGLLLLRSSEMGFFSFSPFPPSLSSSSSSSRILQTLIHAPHRPPLLYPHRARLLSATSLSSRQVTFADEEEDEEGGGGGGGGGGGRGDGSSLLLERLRSRHLTKQAPSRETLSKKKTSAKSLKKREDSAESSASLDMMSSSASSSSSSSSPASFSELSLSEELLSAVAELGLTQPTEVQCRAIPAVLDGKSVVIASHTGSGKTLAYMIPLIQSLRRDEVELEKASRARRPRAVVLCPTRELAEQVFRVAKSICHHAKFRATLIGGGVRMRPQEDALNAPIDMLVGTPGRLLKHIEDGNMAYGDLKYVVLDEADTMFDRGFGPEIKKFFVPLRNRSVKAEDAGFQTILVTATITQGVQKLLDAEFPGIKHIKTSTLHKKVTTARHGFIKLSGTENKLESLLQVLEPSLSKGERVMVFCNTLNSCRAVDHFLRENNIPTVNYHGAVPADERVDVLNMFKNEDKCPALVCTDLAARGLDLVVDHVIMFDFPLNSIDYLHRTGRTARMGAKGRITSLVTKRSLALAEHIEEAIQKGLPLDGVTAERSELSEGKRQSLVRSKPKEGGKTGRYARTPQKKFLTSGRGRTTPSSVPSVSQNVARSAVRSGPASKLVISSRSSARSGSSSSVPSKSMKAPMGKAVAAKDTRAVIKKLGEQRTAKKMGQRMVKVAGRK